MAKLPLGAVRGCSKPECRLAAPINRHHKRHEALWLHVWAHRAANGEPQFRAFVKRYHEFREEDIVRVCLDHHAEIHMIYDGIISQDVARTGVPLWLYSWKQARILMQKLEDACTQWIYTKTPGIDSKFYEAHKSMFRGLNKASARRRAPNRAKPVQVEVRVKKHRKARKARRARKRN